MNQLNIRELNSRIDRAFSETVDFVADAMQQNLQEERWNWPRTTIRKNGTVVSSPRDIVDTGGLIDSQVIEKQKNKAKISYLADHAGDVHQGEPELDRPARPWITATIEERGDEVVEYFESRLRADG